MFDRPGKLSDYIKSPYKNENEARYANNGGQLYQQKISFCGMEETSLKCCQHYR
jgi:hypothetical protein